MYLVHFGDMWVCIRMEKSILISHDIWYSETPKLSNFENTLHINQWIPTKYIIGNELGDI